MPIQKIVKNPKKYHGKIVQVKGTVIEALGLKKIRVYAIKDQSGGTILINTYRKLPRVGEKVKIKGRVRNNYTFERKKILIIEEKKRIKK